MLRDLIEVSGPFILIYFLVLSLIYVFFTITAWRRVTYELHEVTYSGTEEAFASPLTPSVSILLPAFNEQEGIVESVYSLLNLRYPRFELIAINDGSTDKTLEKMKKEFDLVPVHRALRKEIETAAIRGTFVSRRFPDLWVIDKENGGKPDALNAGLNAARYPYFCTIDSDTVLEEHSLLQIMQPAINTPDLTVGIGGVLRVANGCKVDRGEIVDIHLPRSRLAALQVVEYFRAFLVGRVGWDKFHSLLIISGAFGVFRRDAVEEAGGYSTTTVGEDMELVTRLHHHFRKHGEPYRVSFVPYPVCWTEAPETFRSLAAQRRRWQQGLAESLWRHRRMVVNPRYGAIGLFAMPYFFIFELLGPAISFLSYILVIVAFILGILSFQFLLAFLCVSLIFGTLLSMAAIALSEFNFRHYKGNKETWRLIWLSVIDNFGYRQLNDMWRMLAFFDTFRRRKEWGEMSRVGLGKQDDGLEKPVTP